MYEMLVGDVPGFWITDAALRVGRIVDASPAHRRRLDALPGRIEQVLTRALALRPDDRWPSIEAFAAAFSDATSGPAARYTAAQVREIVGRAAQLEAEHPTAESFFTVGGVERIAAEVDIPLEDVRSAMEELGYAPESPAAPLPAPPAPSAPVQRIPGGDEAPASVRIDRVLDGEVRPAAFDAVTAELERAFGRGQATVWDGVLTWRTEGTAATTGRHLEVTIAPREGRTRVQLAAWRSQVGGSVAARIVGVMSGGSVASILGFLVSAGEPQVGALFAVAGMIGGAVVFDRAWRKGDLENETRRIEEVVGRLPLGPGGAA